MAFVVDNSIVIAWFIGDQATSYTDRLRERSRRQALHAPAVWPLELVNALWSLQKRRRLRAFQVDEIVAKAERLGVTVHREAVAARRLLDIAREFALSSYDASYLELAQRLGLPMGVKDGPLHEASRRAGVPIA